MRIGFLYAGQGSQRVGMGRDFYERYPLFRETADHAASAVDFDLKTLSFEGPAEMLSQTQFTQPCMAAFAIGVSHLLDSEGIRPEMACGLSLGEYSALSAADVLDEADLIRLVAFRGKVMAEASSGRNVKMAAVLQTDRNVIGDCCREASLLLKGKNNTAEIANFNCPGQIVISGDAEAIDKASELLKERGTRRIMELQVSGPFHTSLMKSAGDRLREKMSGMKFRDMKIPVVFNATGRPKREEETIPALLEKQVQSSVYLEDSIRYMGGQGIDTILEIGPGHALSKFVKKTVPDITVYSIDTAEDFESTVRAFKG